MEGLPPEIIEYIGTLVADYFPDYRAFVLTCRTFNGVMRERTRGRLWTWFAADRVFQYFKWARTTYGCVIARRTVYYRQIGWTTLDDVQTEQFYLNAEEEPLMVHDFKGTWYVYVDLDVVKPGYFGWLKPLQKGDAMVRRGLAFEHEFMYP